MILSRWKGEQPEHRAINSCLRPICALGGLVVTTIEGTGPVRRPNPEFLHHSLVASRAAAPPTAATPPAVVHAAAAVRAEGALIFLRRDVEKARKTTAGAQSANSTKLGEAQRVRCMGANAGNRSEDRAGPRDTAERLRRAVPALPNRSM